MMLESTKKNHRFGCPACHARIVLDTTLAGIEGPCPACGIVMTAPPLGGEYALVKKKAIEPYDCSDLQNSPSVLASRKTNSQKGRGLLFLAVSLIVLAVAIAVYYYLNLSVQP
ncbi:MAG: hypothetical protein ACSHX0_02030 [Akkermansiaceae bacterium]